MRDLIVLGIILGSLPFCFFRPHLGILVWSWVGYMNPHRLSWGIAQTFPVAYYVALAVLAGFIINADRRKLPLERETILLLLLTLMYTVSSFFALIPEDAWEEWDRTIKILLMTFLTMILMADRKRLRWLLLTIALSLGFYGFKGGIFSLLTGGAYRIWGPENTFIGGNNEMGLALLMTLPILFFLAQEEQNWKLKTLLKAILLLSIISIVFTYSRGAFLGLAVLTLTFLIKLRKISIAVFIVVAGFLLVTFAPEAWKERMMGIQDYEEDASAMGRINAWYFAWNLALDRPLVGAGFQAFDPDLFLIYAPDPDDFHDAHSIYFEVLAEHGFPGLSLFLALLFSSILSVRKLKRTVKYIPSLQWVRNYCDMVELSLVAYMASGTFLGLAYFDLYYHIIAVVIILKTLVKKEMQLLDQKKRLESVKKPYRDLSLSRI